MRLVESEVLFIPQVGTHYVRLAYETLTDAFVSEEDDETDYEINGLRRVTRSLIAEAGVDYAKVVGTATISHQVDAETAVTLYLATAQIEDTDAYRRVTEIWLEAGTLDVSEVMESEGTKSVTTTFLVTEGTTVGPITSRKTSNFEGLNTIIVKTLQDLSGSALGGSSTVPTNSTQSFIPFTYPGITDITRVLYGPTANALDVQITVESSPAQTVVIGTKYVFFQSTNSITQADYTYGGAAGLFRPNSWASVKVAGVGTTEGGATFSDGQGFRGFRTSASSSTGTVSSTGWGLSSFLRYNGQDVVVDVIDVDYTIDINQGPPDPIGSKWVTDCDITLAFDDVDGNKFYRKVIIVTETIPVQAALAALPYQAP